MPDTRYETLAEVNNRLERQSQGRFRPVSLQLFLIVAGALFVGLLLLAGFVFHEVGIVTPLDGMYTWLHTTFGGMEEHPVGAWMWSFRLT